MPQTSNDDRFVETWVVVVNKGRYSLNENQALKLKTEIASGNRGVVMFRDFAISIPYIQEFYMESRKLKPEYQIEQPAYIEGEDPEVLEMRKKKLAELKEVLYGKTKI